MSVENTEPEREGSRHRFQRLPASVKPQYRHDPVGADSGRGVMKISRLFIIQAALPIIFLVMAIALLVWKE